MFYLKMSSYTDDYKWQIQTSLKHSEIPWRGAGCQAALEGTRQEKTRRPWATIQEKVLADVKIGPVDTQ